jgi:hypothetical protein
MLPGENQRERVLTADEEQRYLQSAAVLAAELEESYEHALKGIRATKRGEQPKRPDAFLLRDVSTTLIDCGLRPEECYRLKWENLRDGGIEIFTGKRKASRRRIPASARVLSILEMRRAASSSDWIFPAQTKSGHIETCTLKKHHAKTITASEVLCLRCLRPQTHLPDAVGQSDGPLHAQEARRTYRPKHHHALRSPERRRRAERDGEGTGWAQIRAQRQFDGIRDGRESGCKRNCCKQLSGAGEGI